MVWVAAIPRAGVGGAGLGAGFGTGRGGGFGAGGTGFGFDIGRGGGCGRSSRFTALIARGLGGIRISICGGGIVGRSGFCNCGLGGGGGLWCWGGGGLTICVSIQCGNCRTSRLASPVVMAKAKMPITSTAPTPATIRRQTRDASLQRGCTGLSSGLPLAPANRQQRRLRSRRACPSNRECFEGAN